MLWGLDEHWTTLKRLEDVKQAYDIGLRETPFEIYRQTGYAVGEFLDGILPALLQICVVQAACTVLGAGIGAAIGAAIAGAGAVPGGLYGAEAGFTVGATLLGWLGLGFLFLAVGKNLVSMIVLVRQAVTRAWRAADASPDQRGHEVRQAGQDLARAMGTFMLLILQAIVAWVLKRGIDRAPKLYADLRKSKLGDGFTNWVEQNLDRLMKDAKLRPRQAEGSSAKAPEPTALTPSQLAQRRQAEEEALATPKAMPQKKVPCFNAANMPAAKVPEFDRQLAGQEKGLNDMTVDEYLKGRQAFVSGGAERNAAVAQQARAEYQGKLAKDLADQFQVEGMLPHEADAQAAKIAADHMKTLAALHNPDRVAAGQDVIADFGDRGVNSSIGSQWNNSLGKTHPEWDGNQANSRIKSLDAAALQVPESERVSTKMNAKLERCK